MLAYRNAKVSSKTDEELPNTIDQSMTKTTSKTFLFATLAALVFCINPTLSFADGRAGMSTLGYYKDPYSDEERSRRLYEEGLKHKAKAESRAGRATNAKNTKEKNRLLKKAMKEYQKAVEKQTKAVKLDQENYKAFSELGYALEKKGEPRKAIGAYNFSLRINPRYYLALRYRGEALIQLGLIKDAKESYMVLFKNDQELAAQLMTSFDEWLTQTETTGSLEKEEFIEWLSRRKSLAKIAFGLTNRSKDSP